MLSTRQYVIDLENLENLPKFMVIFGENGIGKSNFLKTIRQKNTTGLIIRQLDYGEKPYTDDPNLTETIKTFYKFFVKKEVSNVEIKNIESFNNTYKTFPKKISELKTVDKFNEYFNSLKKISFGSVQELLILSLPYENIREDLIKFENEYNLKFNYKFYPKENDENINDFDLNKLVQFEYHESKDKRKIYLRDLSSSEKLILHFFLIWRNKEFIKDENTKKLLILDEPDSYCAPKLIVKLVKLIKNLLIHEIHIQVIMTSHNILTMFALEYKDNIYLLNEKRELQEIQDEVRKELLDNIFSLIDFKNLNFKQQFYLTQDYDTKSPFEDLIKIMTNPEKMEGSHELFSKCLNLLIQNQESQENFNKNNVNFYEPNNLEDIKLKYDNKLVVYWPQNKNNKAWDFMIFYRNQLYLFQLYKSSSYKSRREQYLKSIDVMKNLKEPTFEYWINSNFFFVKSAIKKETNINQCQINEIFSIKRIFEGLFKKGQINREPMTENYIKENTKFSIDKNYLVDNYNKNKFKFDLNLKSIQVIDEQKDIYALCFENNIYFDNICYLL